MNPKEDLNVSGKSVVITGGASGIARASAQYLSELGMRVAIWDINEKDGIQAASAIGNNVFFVPCDVTSSDSCHLAAEESAARFGKIDALVNCAGVIKRGSVTELSEPDWDIVLDVCLKGTYLVSKHVIPHIIKTGGGHVVNIASGWGISGGGKASAYCAAKGGVVNLTRAMAIDYGPLGIMINCICPGDIATPLLDIQAEQLGCNLEEMLSSSAAERPLRRIGQPVDVARAIYFFLSGLSSWSAGAILTVDGGGTA